MLFPDAWERFCAPIPEAERCDMIAAYHKRVEATKNWHKDAADPEPEPEPIATAAVPPTSTAPDAGCSAESIVRRLPGGREGNARED